MLLNTSRSLEVNMDLRRQTTIRQCHLRLSRPRARMAMALLGLRTLHLTQSLPFIRLRSIRASRSSLSSAPSYSSSSSVSQKPAIPSYSLRNPKPSVLGRTINLSGRNMNSSRRIRNISGPSLSSDHSSSCSLNRSLIYVLGSMVMCLV